MTGGLDEAIKLVTRANALEINNSTKKTFELEQQIQKLTQENEKISSELQQKWEKRNFSQMELEAQTVSFMEGQDSKAMVKAAKELLSKSQYSNAMEDLELIGSRMDMFANIQTRPQVSLKDL